MTVTPGDDALSSQPPSQRFTRATGPGTSHEAMETKSELSGTGGASGKALHAAGL